MSERTTVYVHARDAISRAGVTSQLRSCPELALVDDPERDDARVAVVVTDVLDDETVRVLRALRRGGVAGAVLVSAVIDDSTVVAAAEAGVCGMVRRSEATPAALSRACRRVAAGQGEVPADLLGNLLDQVGRLQRHVLAPRGLTFAGLTEREAKVLRLVADGRGTAEIATELCYSERTVKNVLHEVTTRLQLRNRSHAVAYAVREGLI